MDEEFNDFLKCIYELTYNGKRQVVFDKIERNFSGPIIPNEAKAEKKKYIKVKGNAVSSRRRCELTSKGLNYLINNKVIEQEY